MILIGIGSNQGTSEAIVATAAEALRELSGGDFRCSSLWRTSPIDCPPGSPDFVNAVVAMQPRPDDSPEAVLTELKDMEVRAGRVRGERNAPRLLDLDLLVFGSERRATKRLILPHPRAVDRRFVLAPAAEVAPDLVWPGTERTVAQLLAVLDDRGSAELVGAAGG